MKLPGLLQRLIDSTDPTQDVKLAAFGATVVAAIAWLSIALPKGITDQWVNAFYGLCALTGIGGSAWAAVDKWNTKTPPPTSGTQQTGGK